MGNKDDFVPVESMLKMTYLEQYAQGVMSYSSRYNTSNSYSYAPVNLVGKYCKYPSYGDFPETYFLRTYGTWWKKSGGTQIDYRPQDFDLLAAEDFVTLGFGSVVVPRDICIYEIYNPGAIIRIWGSYYVDNKWTLLWEGFPQKCMPRSRKFCPPLRKVNCLINVIRLEFNQSHLEYHTSIDAVLLGGYQPTFQPNDYAPSLQFHLIQKGLVLVKNIKETTKPQNVVTFGDKMKTHCDNSLDVDYFSNLPHELILHIFQFLDLKSLSRCAQVNRRFNQISRDQSLYQCINVKIYWNLIESPALDFFLRRCYNLKKLDMSWCSDNQFMSQFDFLSKFISLLMQSTKTLTHLSLNDNYTVDDVVMLKIGQCDKLTDLRLSHTEKWSIASSLSNLHRLVTLDLSMTNINDVDLCKILESNPNLEYLKIDLCENLQNLDAVVEVLMESNRKIKGWSSWKTPSLSAEGIKNFGFCENLEELDLGWCLMNTDPGDCLSHIAAGCKKLKRLVLSEWRGVSDHQLLPVIRSCKELSQLDLLGIKNITAELCERTLFLLPKLRLFDISFCDTIRHDEVEIWRQQYPHITIQRSCQFVVTDYLN